MIWRLSSMPFTGTVLALLTSNIYSPRVTQDNGTWSRLLISFFGMLCSTTKLEIFFWNIRFSSRGSTFPVVHSEDFNTPDSCPVFCEFKRASSFHQHCWIVGLQNTFSNCYHQRREIAAPASQVLIITLTFLTNCHLANSDGLFFLNGIRLELLPIFFCSCW